MKATVIPSSGLEELVGSELGTSPWYELSPRHLTLFRSAAGLGHVTDAAPSLLVLSLIGGLIDEVVDASALGQALNYGLDAAAFPGPMAAGSRYRLRVSLANVRARDDLLCVTYDCRLELEKPDGIACRAELLLAYVGSGSTGSA